MATTQDYIQKSSDGTAVSHLEDSIIFQDDANSRIGIGTDSPGKTLEVNGTGTFSGQLDAPGGLVVGGSEIGSYVPANHKMQIVSSGSVTPLMVCGGSGAVEIWKDNVSGLPSKAAAIGMAKPGVSVTDDLVISTYNGSSWSERVRIDNDGNVGIGDTTPSYKLDVNGTGRFTGELNCNDDIILTAAKTIGANNTGGLSFDASNNGTFSGDVQISGNDIKDSGGSVAITFDGNQNTTFGGDVTTNAAGRNLIINDTATDTNMTTGVNIQQDGADDLIFACQSSDTNQGFTDFADADTFFAIKKNDFLSGGKIGGVELMSFAAADAACGFIIDAHIPNGISGGPEDAAIMLRAWKKDGTGRQAQAYTDQIYQLRNGGNVLQHVWGSGRAQFFQVSATGGRPVIELDQSDVDEPFVKLVGDAASADLTRDLVDVSDVGTATLVGYFKVEIQDGGNQMADGDYFVPFYSLST